MKTRSILMVLWGIAIVAGFSALVMLLWNLVIPGIFGLSCINFWQAAGLLILSRLLFGGVGFGRGRGRGGMIRHRKHAGGRNPIREKWMQMTPEEREEFINRRRQFGFGGPFGRDRFGKKKQEEQVNEDEPAN